MCNLLEVLAFMFYIQYSSLLLCNVGNRAVLYSQVNVGHVIFILKLILPYFPMNTIYCPPNSPLAVLFHPGMNDDNNDDDNNSSSSNNNNDNNDNNNNDNNNNNNNNDDGDNNNNNNNDDDDNDDNDNDDNNNNNNIYIYIYIAGQKFIRDLYGQEYTENYSSHSALLQ